MRRRLSRYLAILAILGLSALLPGEAWALKGHWAFGDARYFTIDVICRDGASLSALYTFPPDTNPKTIDLGARLYTSTSVPLPDPTAPSPSLLREPSAAYGPMLAPTTIFTMTYHANDPLLADINNNGTLESTEVFSTYFTSEYLLWSRHLPVGTEVVITHSGVGFNYDAVEDCYLNPFTVAAGSTTTITAGDLQVDFGTIPPEDMLYRVDATPAFGKLRLNGVNLSPGDTFTQADIDNGLLSYRQNGGLSLQDSFTFSVAGATRVSVRSNEAQSNGNSYDASISGDGTRVAYYSHANNLVGSDLNSCGAFTNGTCPDVFVRDLSAGTTTRVSESSGGAPGNSGSYAPSMAANGTALAFESDASNLVGGGTCASLNDTNGARDIFIHYLFTGSTYRYSISAERFGACDQSNANSFDASISPDGVFAAFTSNANNLLLRLGATFTDTNSASDVFERGGVSGDTVRQSIKNEFSVYQDTNGQAQGNGASGKPSLAGLFSGPTGVIIAFDSIASNLVAGDALGFRDIFVRDDYHSPTDKTVLVSRSSGGVQGNGDSSSPSISHDGRFIAFESVASNLVSGDSGGFRDIFVHDRDADNDGIFDETGAISTTRVSVSSAGTPGNGNSYGAAISAHGRYVAFYSYAQNLVSDDDNVCVFIGPLPCSDIFVHDRETGETRRVSVSSNGAQSNNFSFDPSISADGEYVAFESLASNLVAGDTNDVYDIFVNYAGFTSTFPIFINVKEVYLPVVLK